MTFTITDDAELLHDYEQPLTERMRTLMRLEFVYQQLLFNAEQDSDWAMRAATSSLLDLMAILGRGDIRSEVLKELDNQIEGLKRYQSQPEVDSARLATLIGTMESSRRDLQDIGTHYLQPLKDSEFLSVVKYRSSIPGGTCQFDLPEFSHWLRQPAERRRKDFSVWLACLRPVCDAVTELLWLIREIAPADNKRAINGMYQHSVQKSISCQLLRVLLPSSSTLFPEISGSHQRFTIRFLEWSTIDRRAVQTGHDVDFRLCIC